VPSSSMDDALKTCPYCLLEIPAEARKCGHCGEWVNVAPDSSSNLTPESKILPILYWSSKAISGLNMLAVIGLPIYIFISGDAETPQLIGLIIGMAFNVILAIGFWRYVSTRARWPFVVTAVGSSIITLGITGLCISVITRQIYMRPGGLAWLIPMTFGCISGCSFVIYLSVKAVKDEGVKPKYNKKFNSKGLIVGAVVSLAIIFATTLVHISIWVGVPFGLMIGAPIAIFAFKKKMI